MSSNRGHRAGQCAPEVPRTRIRARGDLQERRTRPGSIIICHSIPAPWAGSSSICHPTSAPLAGNSLIQHTTSAPLAGSSIIQHPTPAHRAMRQPHSAEIRRWRRQSVQMGREICVCLSSSSKVEAMGMGTYIYKDAAQGRKPQLRVSKSGPDAPDC